MAHSVLFSRWPQCLNNSQFNEIPVFSWEVWEEIHSRDPLNVPDQGQPVLDEVFSVLQDRGHDK